MTDIVVFCDFDGTITTSDNIISIMKKFAPPEWEGIKDSILSQQLSIQEGVGKLFSLLPSSKKDEITQYILSHAVIREGFGEFIDFTKRRGIKLYIVSGGIDFFVKPLLEKYVSFEQIYCNESNFDKETIEIIWPYTCDDDCDNRCGCCKPSLLRKLASLDDYKIVIGDSITDLQAAKSADKVIATDFLLQKCEELQLHHSPFTSFFDVISILNERLEV
ncbi:2-hydroxy-3-keto-5-methylthiopentenyl-1-phosphate phosphatase [Bacillus timonensis]|nr:2-hydroxy-3-keto-5-methylthiopentenyl-1-phosphate phosphatase [Bacillus timonensis]